jgi:hypothetical protein
VFTLRGGVYALQKESQAVLVKTSRSVISLTAVANEEEGAMAGTAHNKRAGEWLRKARVDRKRSGPRFAAQLASALQIPFKVGALYSYEAGTRAVPAAVLIAASEITGIPITADQAQKQTLVAEIAAEVLRQMNENRPQ